MLIDKINADLLAARRANDAVAKGLLIPLISEANMVGKNKRNGPSTDDEVMAMVKKFATNAEETIRLLTDRNATAGLLAGPQRELEILNGYLPTQLTRDELLVAVQAIVADKNLAGPKAMGTVMAELKTRHGGQYDGKMASEVTKQVLQ